MRAYTHTHTHTHQMFWFLDFYMKMLETICVGLMKERMRWPLTVLIVTVKTTTGCFYVSVRRFWRSFSSTSVTSTASSKRKKAWKLELIKRKRNRKIKGVRMFPCQRSQNLALFFYTICMYTCWHGCEPWNWGIKARVLERPVVVLRLDLLDTSIEMKSQKSKVSRFHIPAHSKVFLGHFWLRGECLSTAFCKKTFHWPVEFWECSHARI